MKTPPIGWKLIGYYHKASSGDALEDDFFFSDAINGDCPDCHPCYIDESVMVHPTPSEYKSAPEATQQEVQYVQAAVVKSVVGAGPNDVGIQWRGGFSRVGEKLYKMEKRVDVGD